MKKILLSYFAILAIILFSKELVIAQCNVATVTTLAPAPTCTYQTLIGSGSGGSGLGAGESRNISFTSGFFYDFSFTNNTQSSGFCANGTRYTTNPTTLSSLGGTLAVGMYRNSTTWNATSAVLQYRLSTPTNPGTPTVSTNGCTQITLQWTASSNAQNYLVEISTNNFSSVFSSQTVSGNSATFTGLTANTSYQARVRARNGNGACLSSYSGTLTFTTASNASIASFTRSDNGQICVGGSATVEVNPTGGTGTYTYSWGGSGTGSTKQIGTGTISIANTYTYNVTVTPSGVGCSSANGSTSITVYSDPTVSSLTVSNAAICKGGNTVFTGQIAGGVPAATPSFTWTQPVINGFSYSTSGVNNNPNSMTVSVDNSSTASAGTYNYSFTATQPNSGCSVTSSNLGFGLFNDPARPTATKSPNVSSVCVGQILTLTSQAVSPDGTGVCSFEYQYSTNGGTAWTSSNGSGTWSTSVPSFAATGNDNRIRIRRTCSGNGCATTISPEYSEYSWTVVPDPAISSAVILSNPVCNNNNVAVLRATPTGGTGTPTFTWEWSADGLTGWSTANVGTFNANASPNDITTPSLNASRYYRVKVNYSGAGCDESSWRVVAAPVLVPDVPLVEGASINFDKSFCGAGIINAVPGENGTTCRFFLNSTSGTLLGSGTAYSTNSNILTQNPGVYTIVIESYNDNTGCRSSQVVVATITITPAFSGSLSISNYNGFGVSCSEGGVNNNGSITASVNSTAYPISYQWSNGQFNSVSSQTNTTSGLTAGNYSVTIGDNSGCSVTLSTTLAAPQPLSINITNQSFSGFNTSCFGANDGQATASVTGGPNASYSYLWSNGVTGSVNSNLIAGTYSLQVTDANGCTANESTTLVQPSALSFTSVTGYVCSGSSYISATITITASGGSGSYEYSSNGGSSWQSSNIITGLANGASVQLRVRDANATNCLTSTQAVTVTFPPSGQVVDVCNYIYVAPDGDPNGTLGTKACPVQSIVQAINIYNNDPTRNHILVLGGNYPAISQTVVIPAGITIDGSYSRQGDDWVKNTGNPSNITINPPAVTATSSPANISVRHHIGINPSGNNFILKDLNVSVLPAGASGVLNGRGTSIYGIYLNGRTGYTISRCVITTGAASNGNDGASHTGSGGAGGGGAGAPANLDYKAGCSRCGVAGSAGQPGNGGAGGGAGGAGCCSSGCNIFGCDANGCTASNGFNGGTGSQGSGFAFDVRPTASVSGNSFFVPINGSQGSNGFGGGGGGAGGAGASGTCCACSCGPFWGTGGAGGAGGNGGLGGNFGFGGGSSIAIFAWGGSGNLTDTQLNPGAAGSGGRGSNGQPGSSGGNGSAGGDNTGYCDGGKGGTGGRGGAGGAGGRGQDGANGFSQELVQANSASVTVSGTSIPNNGTITANVFRGCTESEIILTKSGSSGSWNITTNPTYTRNLTQSATSYTNTDNTISVFYTTTGTKNVTVGSTTLRNFIQIYQTRVLPAISLTPSVNICPSTPINISTTATAKQYEWIISNVSNPTVALSGSPYASQSPGTINPPSGGWLSGQTYQVRLRVFDECCGWSRPVYQEFTIAGTPGTAAISGPSSVCANSTNISYSVPAITNASTYEWNVSGIVGATIASGTNTTSISVNFGAATSGNITLTPRNSCGVAGTTISIPVTVRALPIVALSGTTELCISSPQTSISASVSTPSGSPIISYLWSPSSAINGSNTGTSINTQPLTVGSQTFTLLVTDANNCTVSANANITIDENTVGGEVTGGVPVCSGSTSSLLSLSGEIGTVIRWESAVSPFTSWQPISNTNTLYTSQTLTETTQFRAVVKNGACTTEFSLPTLVQVDQFTVANAGVNQSQVCSPEYELQGNIPVSGTGVWSILQGNGDFSNSNLNNAIVSNMNLGSNVYTWTLDNGACPSSESNVTIVKKDSSYLPIQIFALPNSICPGDEITLSLNGGLLGTNATWAWYSGSCGGSLITNNSSITITPPSDTWYYLRAEGDCNTTLCMDAFVDVAVIPQISWTGKVDSDWRKPDNWCGLIPTITSEVLIPAGTPHSPIVYDGVVGVAKNVTVLSGAKLDIESGGKLCVNEPCAAAYAGADVTICAGDSYQLNGFFEGVAPLSYSWTPTTYLSNPNVSNPIVQNVPNIGSITYTFTVTDANGNMNSDDVTITVTPQPSVADAGTDFSICSGSVTLNAAPITNGTGQWTLISGSGSISNPSSNSTNVNGLGFSSNTFRWTVTSGVCPPDFDEVIVTRDRIPVANAGTDISGACVNSAITLNNSASANFGTPSWSIVNGGGVLSGANTLSPTYTPVAGDLNISPVILELTVTSNNSCATVFPTATDNMNITIQPLPTASAGSNASICASGGYYTINDAILTNGVPSWTATASSGTPTGILSGTNTLTPTYTAGLGDAGKTITLTLTVTSNNSCNPATAQSSMTINVIAPPIVEAGNGATICAGTDYVFNPGEASATNFSNLQWVATASVGSPAGNLVNDNTLEPIYESDVLDGDKVITLTLTATGNSACSSVSVSDQMSITVQALPEATLTTYSEIICAGSTYTVSGASAQNGTIVWTAANTAGGNLSNANSLTPSYESVPAEGGREITLTMTVTGNGVCSSEEDNEIFSLNVDALPLANAGPNAVICATASHVFATNDATASNYSSVSWTISGNAGNTLTNNSSLMPTYNSVASDAGKDITLTLVAQGTGACSSVQSTPSSMNIAVLQLPLANAGSATDIMCGDGVQTFQVNDASSSFGSILWTVPSGSGNIFDPTTLQPIYAPDLSVVGSSVTLTLTVTGVGVCSSFIDEDTKEIAVNAPATEPTSISGVTSVCFGGSTVLTAVGGSEGSGAIYEWGIGAVGSNIISGANTSTYTTPSLNNTTTYWVRRVSNSACSNVTDAATITVNVDPLPVAVLPTVSATICAGSNYTIIGADAQNGTVSWSASGGNGGLLSDVSSLEPTYTSVATEGGNTPIILTMIVSGLGSCSTITDEKIFTLTVNPLPIVNAGNDATICASTSHVLNASSSNYNTNSIVWALSSNASNQNLINPNSLSPTYESLASDGGKVIELEITVNGIGACSSTMVSDVMEIIVESLPNINAGVDATICANTSYQINDFTGANFNNASIQWTVAGNASGSSLDDVNSQSPIYNSVIADAGNNITLSVQVSGVNSCASFTAGDSKLLSVDFRPIANVPTDNAICAGSNYIVSGAAALYGSIEWTASASSGTPAGNLVNPNSINPTYESNIADAGKIITLTLKVTSDNTCNPLFDTDEINIEINPLPIANAGSISSTNICEGTSFTVSGASALNGTYEWIVSASSGSPEGFLSSTSDMNPTYQSVAADAGKTITLTLIVTSNNACNPLFDTDEINIVIDPLPAANAGSLSSTSICEGTSFTVSGASALNGTYEWIVSASSGSPEGFLSSTSDMNPTYQSVAADAGKTIILTLTVTSNNGCGAANDIKTVNIFVESKPFVNAGTASNVCENNIVSLNATANNYSSIGWSSDGDGNFNSASVLDPEYTHGSADVGNEIELTILVDGVGACSSETTSSSVLVTIYQNPNITIIGGTPTTFISSDPDVDLNTLATFSPGGGTFSGGVYITSSGVFSPSTAGVGTHSITYTITDSNGCSDSFTFDLEVN